jgi:molybdenum cofactor cytidylyltransferase
MMRLWEALSAVSPRRAGACGPNGVQKGEVVTFVGAGGKTTAMYCLGRELASQGWHVIVTTTTMIRPPTLQPGEDLVVADDHAQALDLVKKALSRNHLVTLAAQHLPAENKLKGVPPGWIASLMPVADAVLVEADGSRGLPLKAPAAHEPVVPVETSLLVPVVGIDAVGLPLSEVTVHRPALVAALTGLALGDVITTAAVSALLVHPQGALKNAPAHARIVPLINKVQSEAALGAARDIAACVMDREDEPELQRVLIAAVAADDPVIECWRHVSAVVLAAGGSSRLGRPKQLLPVAGTSGTGRTMIEQVLHEVLGTHVDQVIVVLGHAAAEITPHIPAGCRTVLNPDWEAGISSSIRAGLEAVHRRAEAVLFVLADQPLLTGTALERILRAYYGTTKAIVAPVYRGQRGAPALFDRRLFPALRSLRGDVGGRKVIRQFPHEVLPVETDTPEIFLDVDTASDYEELLKHARN